MRFPLAVATRLGAYVLRHKLRPRPEWQQDASDPRGNPFAFAPDGGNGAAAHPMLGRRFPLVLMLEPLHACNLACAGCGRIREYQASITETLPLERCLGAVEECGAPVVSICGGEPLLYPELPWLVEELLKRRRYLYLCTNGLLLRKRLGDYRPHRRLCINVHLDGLEKTHDRVVGRAGVFREALEALRTAKAARFKLTSTPAYLAFLRGARELPCTAWGNSTYNVWGWRSPCYLIADAHYQSFAELMNRTPWASYGAGRDSRCAHCLVHCGFEPSAARGISPRRGDGLRLLRWMLG